MSRVEITELLEEVMKLVEEATNASIDKRLNLILQAEEKLFSYRIKASVANNSPRWRPHREDHFNYDEDYPSISFDRPGN